jgi:hypothetical protein
MPNSILPPIRTPFFDPKNGQISWSWIKWFQAIDRATTNSATAFIADTHARRTLYSPSGYQSGTVYFETDRNWYYEDTGASWRWLSGLLLTTFPQLPTDLGTSDIGALAYASDTTSLYLWNGTAWKSTAIPSAIDGNITAIQERRGLKSALPASLPIAQLYYATDTFELYVGTGTSTHKVEADANSIQGIGVNPQAPANGQLLIYDGPTAAYVPGDPIVSGTAADGSAPVGNPVRVGGTGTDGKVHTLLTDPLGDLNVIALENQGIGVLLQNILLEMRATKAAILALDRTLSPQDFTAEQFQDQFIN